MIFGLQAQEKAINSAIFPGLQGGPLMHVIAAKAWALGEALKHGIARSTSTRAGDARTMAQVLVERGLRVVSGRTDCTALAAMTCISGPPCNPRKDRAVDGFLLRLQPEDHPAARSAQRLVRVVVTKSATPIGDG